jgi:hypothetical protein
VKRNCTILLWNEQKKPNAVTWPAASENIPAHLNAMFDCQSEYIAFFSSLNFQMGFFYVICKSVK